MAARSWLSPWLIVDRLVGRRPEIAEHFGRHGRVHHALGHQDANYILGRIHVRRGTITAVPSITPGRGEKVGAACHHGTAHTPACAMAEEQLGALLLLR